MSRAAEGQAKSTYKDQKAGSKLYGANAAALYSQLIPQYTNMALNPQGFAPTDRARMTTTSMQSAGGSTAGAVEQGNLQAARTGNAGAYQGSLSQSARAGMQQNADNALKVDNANALLKEKQRDAGLSGMGGLYDDNLKASIGLLNAENDSTNALTNAGKSGWFQNMTGLISSLGSAADGAGSVKKAWA